MKTLSTCNQAQELLQAHAGKRFRGRRTHPGSRPAVSALSAFALWAVALIAWPLSAEATGFRLMDQSASAAGQASAFAAQADDPSAVYYNPAGMTQLRGIQTSIGVLFLGGSTSYTSPTGATAHGGFGSSFASPPPLNIYVTANLGDLGLRPLSNLTVGLGVVSPFGLSYEYPATAPFAPAVYKETMQLIDIKPTVAYRFNDMLSVGLGADIYTLSGIYGEGQHEYHFNNPNLTLLGLNPRAELNGKDTALGFNASVMYTPLRNGEGKPLVNIGFVYRSQATLNLEGQLLSGGGLVGTTNTTIVLPQVYTAAVAVWPVRNVDHEWKLELDVDYTGWKSVRNTDIHLNSALPISTIGYPRNWSSTYTVMIGTEYRWLRPPVMPEWEVAVRGGYWHSQTPQPNSTFVPTIPDSDSHSLSVGLGLLCKGQGRFLGFMDCGRGLIKGIGLDLAYKALIYEVRTVSGNINPIAALPAVPPSDPTVVNGRYSTVLHGGFVNLRVNF